ncbi:DNA primase [Campylobacter felis]|uniref:DNA primase n=1 Tax=Campylobacter felis TaxID=2974565 RepID=A0ABT7I626_9BACT|nr:DNA primase [Campylobacter upsaliensis]MDL0147481.1 DNA primase [Campylobacter felis]
MIANLEEIKARADILSVVEAYMPLQKSGSLYKGCCPFHSERTPSFMVNTNKNLYFCFGCNEGGDSIKFIQKINHCEFSEAVEEVAKICNISVNYEENKKGFSKSFLYETMEAINEHLKSNLAENESVINELKERGLSEEDIKKFEFGYYEIEKLILYLRAKNMLEMAINLGVINEDKKRGFYSYFDKRITLPIRNEMHKIIAFSGRIRKGVSNPAKYINSKESYLYKKSFTLFNLSNAKSSIAKQKEVILCEGYFDVLALRKFGFENVVASCGTAFSLSQLSILHKMSSELKYILSFDKDNAGENANLRTLELFFKNGFFNVSVRVISKKVKDFGDFLRLGLESVEGCFKDYDGFEYYIRLNLKRANEDKEKIHAFFKQIKELINNQANFFLKDSLISKAAEFFNCEKKAFLQNEKLEYEGNFTLLSVLVKNIIINEKALILAQNYFKSEDFKEFGLSLKAYFENGVLSRELMKLSCDERLKILNDEELKECFRAYKKELLNKELSKAKAKANVGLIIELGSRLRDLA